MNFIIELAKLFSLSLGYGVFVFAPVAKSEMTGGGFQKLLSTVCVASLFFAAILNIVNGMAPLALENILIYISSIAILFHRQLHDSLDKKNIILWLLYLVPSLIGFVSIYYFRAEILDYLFVSSSIYYLGAITYAMILGHWYLVTPKLSEKPLKVALYVTWAVFLPKLIWSSYEMISASEYLEMGTRLGGGYAFNWLMFIMRAVWGYLIILVMSLYAWKLVSIRSIQSATGVFYAMTIFVFIGELISGYLFFKFGLYI